MSFPMPDLGYDNTGSYGAPAAMPTPVPTMPTAAPYDHQSTYPQAGSHPCPPSQSVAPPAYQSNNGFLAPPPPMGPFPQNTSSTYVAGSPAGSYYPSRAGSPCSAMTATAVGSDHSHDAGHPQSRALDNRPQKPHVANPKPRPTGKPPKRRDAETHKSGCCIIM